MVGLSILCLGLSVKSAMRVERRDWERVMAAGTFGRSAVTAAAVTLQSRQTFGRSWWVSCALRSLWACLLVHVKSSRQGYEVQGGATRAAWPPRSYCYLSEYITTTTNTTAFNTRQRVVSPSLLQVTDQGGKHIKYTAMVSNPAVNMQSIANRTSRHHSP